MDISSLAVLLFASNLAPKFDAKHTRLGLNFQHWFPIVDGYGPEGLIVLWPIDVCSDQ